MTGGAIAGFALQDIRVSVYDGKHHAVDSKEVAFVSAGRKAFLAAIREASPIVLEPIVRVAISVAVDRDRRRDQRSRDATRAASAGRTRCPAAAPRSRALVPLARAAGLPVAAQGDHRRRRHIHDGPEPLRPGARRAGSRSSSPPTSRTKRPTDGTSYRSIPARPATRYAVRVA